MTKTKQPVKQTNYELLKAIRDRFGSQKKFCKELSKEAGEEISASTISKWLSCENYPNGMVVKHIEKLLKADISVLFPTALYKPGEPNGKTT